MASDQTDTTANGILAVGFLALAGGVLAAYAEPATEYELSIYASTPDAFWAGVAVATGVGLVVALFGRTARSRVLGLALGAGSYAAIVGLPLLRNYHYFGFADGMTHLAWARGVMTGEVGALSLLYPGIHTFAVYVAELTGTAVTRSMMYVVFLLAVTYVLFVPMCAWALTRDLRVTAIALFSAFMLLPVTNISTQLVAHTTTQSLLFLPVAVYLLIRYLQSGRTEGVTPTGVGALLIVALSALVLYHPQQALNFLLMLVSITGIQWFARRWVSDLPADAPRAVYTPTGVLALFWAAWVQGHARFQSGAENALREIRNAVFSGSGFAADTAQRGDSLAEIGSGLLEIFLKIFAVSTVFSAVAAALLLLAVARWYSGRRRFQRSFHRYVAVAFVPVTGVFALYMLGSVSTQAFRHLSFLLVFITLLGAMGLGRGWKFLSDRVPDAVSGSVIVVALAVALVVSVLTIFPSPWIYLPSQHVTEMQMNGYSTAFKYANESVEIRGVRGNVDRYADAHYARLAEDARFETINETAMLGDASEYYGTNWYFTVTELDRQREIGAYEEIRYSRASFESAPNQRGVNTVIDNGEFHLYYVTN